MTRLVQISHAEAERLLLWHVRETGTSQTIQQLYELIWTQES